MPNLFDALARDHEEVKRMLAELETGPTATGGAGADELAQRKKMAQELVIEESKHETAEEMIFWPAVRERVEGGGKLADQAIEQEQEGKHVLDKLDKLDAGDPEFESLLGEFIRAGREHIAFEETQVWPKLRPVLSDQEVRRMGETYETAKQAAPTRPHPNIHGASTNKLISKGPMVAATDRLRDKLTRRGKG
jgi:hemerythrin superfamily protein